MFTSPDPKLHRNEQAPLRIKKDLLEADRRSEAGKWLIERYIRHNPVAASGLDGVAPYFVNVAKQQPMQAAPSDDRTAGSWKCLHHRNARLSTSTSATSPA